MTYIKNRRSISYFENLSFYENIYKQSFKLTNMYSLESIVYVVINKKIKDHLKSNVEKKILIEYDDDIIYRVYISISQKIKRVKNFDIYDHKSTSKINIEFDENLIEAVIDSTMMNFSVIHIKLTTKEQEIQFQTS